MAGKLNIQLTKEQRNGLIIAAVVLIVGGVLYFKYFWAPIAKRIDDAKQKIEDADKKIDKAKSQASRLPRIQKELEVLNQQATDVEQRLPKDKDVPKVLETLTGLAERFGVMVNTFAPGPSSAKQYFIEVPYTVTVTGSYNQLGELFSSIAQEERIFNIRNVIFNIGGTASIGGQPLSVSFTLVSYQYKG